MKTIVSLLSITVTFVFLSTGCRTPVALDPMIGQPQTAVYQSGYFYATVEEDADMLFQTVIRTLDNMGILRTGEMHRDDFINIYARKVGDEKVIIRVRQVAPSKSEIRIRVGKLGSLPQSQVIYAKIKEAL